MHQKSNFSILFCFFSFLFSYSQVGIGNTNPQAALDVTSTTDGLLIPRVALTTTTASAPVLTITTSEMVYNTATAGDVTPGYYYWNGTKWVKFTVSTATSDAWQILGNAGTVAGTNFLGTTDNVDLIFKRNNIQAGKLHATNTSFGVNALAPTTLRNRNTAIGVEALYLNDGGDDNTALGYQALRSAASGSGARNVALGNNTLAAVTTGGDNTAVGVQALTANTTGNNNIAIGRSSMAANIDGYDNTAIGMQSLDANTSGNNNAAIGRDALGSSTVGGQNTAIGYSALNGVTTGSNNIGIGYNAQVPTATASNQLSIGNVIYGTGATGAGAGSIGIGTSAPNAKLDITSTNDGLLIPRVALTGTASASPLTTPTTSEMVYNTATAGVSPNNVTPGFYYWNGTKWVTFGGSGASGWLLTGNAGTTAGTNFLGTTDDIDLVFKRNSIKAGRINTLHTAFGLNASLATNISGYANSAFGVDALLSNTNGGLNSAFGAQAMKLNTTGFYNSAFGDQALMNNTGGQSNTAIGYWSLHSNTDYNNTAIGASSLAANTSGQSNTAIGMSALLANNTGLLNTATGYGSLSGNLGGQSNTATGYNALLGNTNGNYNTAIGYSAFPSGTSYSFSTALGYNATITASYQARIGDSGTTSIGGQVGWTTVSDKRFKSNIHANVPGLDFILKLKPVTYNLNLDAIASFMKTPDSSRNKEGEKLKEKILQTGFLAQDVEQAAKESNYNFSGIDFPKNEQDYYGLRYAEFTVPLVKAVQEQQEMIEAYKLKISDLEKRLEVIEKLLKK